jgi:stage II sporulation protein D
MKNVWSAVAVAMVALSYACAGGVRPKPIRVTAPYAPKTLRIKLADGGPIRRVALEDYVRAAIISEFAPPSGEPELVERMLEVQAVIARTYAIAHASRHEHEGYDLCSTTHCQLYQPSRLNTSRWARAAADATERTSGMVLWYGSSPARALFHADCGGHTSAAGDVWGGMARPYLAAATDDGPAESAHTAWRYEVEQRALVAALNADPRTRVGNALRSIVVVERDEGGRATLLLLRGTHEPVVRGEELRMVLTRAFGVKSVRSTRFEVHRAGQLFIFTGQGYGHGVGLCQVGALARLKAGARPEQVLARYYPGTRLWVLR